MGAMGINLKLIVLEFVLRIKKHLHAINSLCVRTNERKLLGCSGLLCSLPLHLLFD